MIVVVLESPVPLFVVPRGRALVLLGQGVELECGNVAAEGVVETVKDVQYGDKAMVGRVNSACPVRVWVTRRNIHRDEDSDEGKRWV